MIPVRSQDIKHASQQALIVVNHSLSKSFGKFGILVPLAWVAVGPKVVQAEARSSSHSGPNSDDACDISLGYLGSWSIVHDSGNCLRG